MATRLDIGCGTIRKPGYIGIDCNVACHPDVHLDADEGLPCQDDTIDAIWMDNSLEHFKRPSFVLEECHRVLKKDGVIEVIIPNCQWFPLWVMGLFCDIHWFWNWWMGLPFKRQRGFHYTLWTGTTLSLSLKTLGFRIVSTTGSWLAKQAYVKAIKL